MASKKKKTPATEMPSGTCMRAIRLELVKPLTESWETAGATMRAIAKAVPILGNAALDSMAAFDLVGGAAMRAKVAPDMRGKKDESVHYQAVIKKMEDLRQWAKKSGYKPWIDLDVSSEILNEAKQAARTVHGQSRKERTRGAFKEELILLGATLVTLSSDAKGMTIDLKLRSRGVIRFAIAHSTGRHRDLLRKMVDGKIEYRSAKVKYDERRRKWFVLLSYKAPIESPAPNVRPENVLVVHRGIRNALTFLDNVRGVYKAVPGGSYVERRKRLRERARSVRRISAEERGSGAQGHGLTRRNETNDVIGDKVARLTTTFCQQMAAAVVNRAREFGCGTIVIEDYGGIGPADDRGARIVLDGFPFYQLKMAINSARERAGLRLLETSSGHISTTCPRCSAVSATATNPVTGIFRCRECDFGRPVDWVAVYWMLKRSGFDASKIDERLQEERAFSDKMRERKTEEAAE